MAVSVASISAFARLLISDMTSDSFAGLRVVLIELAVKASRNIPESSVWVWCMKDVCPVSAKALT
jgi:hypothetical protein